MKERTLRILAALVDDFTKSAAPVASQKLLKSGQFKVSSATVRNEFSLLESVGLIQSPHTSAGKVPTQKGYRFFVDELLDRGFQDLSADRKLISNVFQKHVQAYRSAKTKESLFDSLRLAAQLSGNIGFCMLDHNRGFFLGLSNVLRAPEFAQNPEKAAEIVEILEGREAFSQFLNELNLPYNQVEIFIGEENLLEAVSSCGMVVSRFQTEFDSGYIGLLGPIRMRYGFNRELIRNLLQMIR
ncbi:hypothetical protein CSB37_00010 [bacterium DOLZORAL124_38_8]|nr:MAG: hypothetical protein CSB37_00010 [bacterium DOLZORAL124_38_8]